ncbi:MAG TPA: hypothetical protein VIR98_01545 [Candidatus Paceibacterota bacterium]|jgi:hypothetical protein
MEKPFKNLAAIEIPDELSSRVHARLNKARYVSSMRRLVGFSALSAASFVSLIFSIVYLGSALSASGIGSYLSLIFSEGVGVFAYLKELLYVVLESLPIAAAMATISALCVSLWSVPRLMRQAFLLTNP